MVVKRVKEAVRIELEKRKAMDVPVIIYDGETQAIYQENSDGTRTEAVSYTHLRAHETSV